MQEDDIAQIATSYTIPEVKFFQAVVCIRAAAHSVGSRCTMKVEQVMLAQNEAFCISSTAALREAGSHKLTKSQAQNVLTSFVTEGRLFEPRYGVSHALPCRNSHVWKRWSFLSG